jgi:hypothetical protein
MECPTLGNQPLGLTPSDVAASVPVRHTIHSGVCPAWAAQPPPWGQQGSEGVRRDAIIAAIYTELCIVKLPVNLAQNVWKYRVTLVE